MTRLQLHSVPLIALIMPQLVTSGSIRQIPVSLRNVIGFLRLLQGSFGICCLLVLLSLVLKVGGKSEEADHQSAEPREIAPELIEEEHWQSVASRCARGR